MDIGANIGLLSIPLLTHGVNVKVVSVEASPETFSYLKRTWSQSQHRDRWTIIRSAVGCIAGQAAYWVSTPKDGAFDGLRDTGRGGPKRNLTVEVRTLDQIWRDTGQPRVSVVKIDVEGGERDVLAGGKELIARERPALVVEWSQQNLPMYGIRPEELLGICRDIGYQVYSHPNLCLAENESILSAAMAQTETFLLVAA
jgi:FkbM family methyltransferase